MTPEEFAAQAESKKIILDRDPEMIQDGLAYSKRCWNFRIGYELGGFKFDRLPPDVTVNKLTIDGRVCDITGTVGSVTTSLIVEIAGKEYAGVDNLNGTWKLPGDRIAVLRPGTHSGFGSIDVAHS